MTQKYVCSGEGVPPNIQKRTRGRLSDSLNIERTSFLIGAFSIWYFYPFVVHFALFIFSCS